MSKLTLQELIDRAEVHDNLMGYLHHMDRANIDELMATFHEGADIGFPSDVYQGKGEGFIREFLANEIIVGFVNCSHFVANELIEIDGDAAYCEAYLYSNVEATKKHKWDGHHMVVIGRYVSRMERRDGVWKLAEHRLLLDWQRKDLGGGWYDLPEEQLSKRFGTDPADTHEVFVPPAKG